MSDTTQDPDWTLGWRLRRSLEYGGIDVAEMAEVIEVHRTTISKWFHDEVVPRRVYLSEWARQTGVRVEWLLGEDPKVPGDGPRSRVRAGRRAVTDNRDFGERKRRSPAKAAAKSHSYQECARPVQPAPLPNLYQSRLNKRSAFSYVHRPISTRRGACNR